MINREKLREELREGIYNVSFTKINGDFRKMKCTLISSYYPEPSGTHKENSDILSVWDIDKEDWRSFRIENVIEYEQVG